MQLLRNFSLEYAYTKYRHYHTIYVTTTECRQYYIGYKKNIIKLLYL